MHLYVIRHADPDYENDTLTAQGHREAEALARRMATADITHIYSSPVARALLTAGAIARRVPHPIAQEDWLIEPPNLTIVQDGVRYALWDRYGETVRAHEPLPTRETWDATAPLDAPEVREAWQSFRLGADQLLARHGYTRDGCRYRVDPGSRDRVAVVAHNGTFLLFVAHLLELPLPLVWCGFYSWPSSVTVFHMEEHSAQWAVPRALNIADVSHLYADGLAPQPRAFGPGRYTPFL